MLELKRWEERSMQNIVLYTQMDEVHVVYAFTIDNIIQYCIYSLLLELQ